MMRVSPTASEQDATGAIVSMTPAVDRKASTLTAKDQERRSRSLGMRAAFKCTNLAASRPSLLQESLANRLHNLQGTTSESEGCYSLEGSLFCFNSEYVIYSSLWLHAAT